jgi:hypothetical protein
MPRSTRSPVRWGTRTSARAGRARSSASMSLPGVTFTWGLSQRGLRLPTATFSARGNQRRK